MDDGRSAILLEKGMTSWRWTHGYVEDVAAAVALAVMDESGLRAGPTTSVRRTRYPGRSRCERSAGRRTEVARSLVIPEVRLPGRLDFALDTKHHLFTDSSRIRWELEYEESVAPARVDPALFDYAAEDAALTGLLDR